MSTSSPTYTLDAAKLRAALAYRKIGVYQFAHLCAIGETTASYVLNGARRPGRLVYPRILAGLHTLGIPESEVASHE